MGPRSWLVVVLLVIPAAAATEPAQGGSLKLAWDERGQGAYHVWFAVSPDNDLRGDIYTYISTRDGDERTGTASAMVAELQDRKLTHFAGVRAAQGDGDVGYTKSPWASIQAGPLLGGDGWATYERWGSLSGRSANRTVEFIVAWSAAETFGMLNVTWSRGVTAHGVAQLPDTDVIALRADELGGISAGVEWVAAVNHGSRYAIATTHGLAGWWTPQVYDTIGSWRCSAPTGECQQTRSTETALFGTDEGDWSFEIDHRAELFDPRPHVLMAVKLPEAPE